MPGPISSTGSHNSSISLDSIQMPYKITLEREFGKTESSGKFAVTGVAIADVSTETASFMGAKAQGVSHKFAYYVPDIREPQNIHINSICSHSSLASCDFAKNEVLARMHAPRDAMNVSRDYMGAPTEIGKPRNL